MVTCIDFNKKETFFHSNHTCLISLVAAPLENSIDLTLHASLMHAHLHMHTHTYTGNDIGDACEMDQDEDGVFDALDSDGDKVFDSEDVAPENKNIFRTDFSRHMTVPLTAGSIVVNPQWEVKGNVSTMYLLIAYYLLYVTFDRALKYIRA